MSWSISASDLSPTRCCVRRQGFERGLIEADLISDSDRLHLGEVCLACLRQGADHIERRMRFELRMSSRMAEAQAHTEKRAAEEPLKACPSFEEYEALEAGCAGPRYATDEEAQAAFERGGW